METNYTISIPKPCHEDWSKMTPNAKGRFCKSCTKTVVDFTKMTTKDIQDYIHNNKHKRICGHIKQSQLNTVNLKIPETVFNQNLSFQRLFLLAILISMGITLFNCEDEKGKTKKIESIEIVNTQQNLIDTIINTKKPEKTPLDTTIKKKVKSKNTKVTKQQIIDGLMIIETGGIEVTPIETNDIKPIAIDSLEIETPVKCFAPEEEDLVLGLLIVDNPPEFNDTPKGLSRQKKKEYLSKTVTEIVKTNFNTAIANNLGLKGKQKIWVQFTISEKGYAKRIKVRATHKDLENEAIRVIKLLPEFKPAMQNDKAVSVVYNLPITFIVED